MHKASAQRLEHSSKKEMTGNDGAVKVTTAASSDDFSLYL
jgi:hypothetical protein